MSSTTSGYTWIMRIIIVIILSSTSSVIMIVKIMIILYFIISYVSEYTGNVVFITSRYIVDDNAFYHFRTHSNRTPALQANE